MSLVAQRTLSGTRFASWGGGLWLVFVAWRVTDLTTFAWSTALLAFAALVLVPLLLELLGSVQAQSGAAKLFSTTRLLQFPAAIMLLCSCSVSPGLGATLLAGPWICLTVLLAIVGLCRCFPSGVRPFWAFSHNVALLFMGVGGAWTLADRLGLHPLGFGTDIVQLTAVHFHFAGLVLPVIAGMILREYPWSRLAMAATGGILAGVPLVALGITSNQLWSNHAIEALAALVLAGSAIVMAGFQLRLAVQSQWPTFARMFWAVSSFSLIFGMSLAVLYAMRSYFSPLPWLNLPWMRALHGTANAVGFAGCGTIGWCAARLKRTPNPT